MSLVARRTGSTTRQHGVSRDVVFDEAASWNWEESGDGEATVGGVSSSFTIEYEVYSNARALAQEGVTEQTPGGASPVLEKGKPRRRSNPLWEGSRLSYHNPQ